MRLRDIITATLGASVGSGGSFTVNYPVGRSADDYLGATGHELVSQSARTLAFNNDEFMLTFGASNITVTMRTNVSFGSGDRVFLHLDRAEIGRGELATLVNSDRMARMIPVRVSFGAPATAVANGVCASQAGTAATPMTINGGLAAAGVATFDVPRNVVAAWTNTATVTVTGTDEYGRPLVETSASGTSFTGKKAFKTVTSVVPSTAITGATVGSGVVLGLPMFIADAADVIREAQDGAVPGTGGTFVAGDQAVATATTGDVRGTYAPNAAPNAARVYEATFLLRDGSYAGRAQFAG